MDNEKVWRGWAEWHEFQHAWIGPSSRKVTDRDEEVYTLPAADYDAIKETLERAARLATMYEAERDTARTALAEKEAECDAHKELLLVNSNRIITLEAENTRLRVECESLRDERDLLLARWPTEEKPTSFTTAG